MKLLLLNYPYLSEELKALGAEIVSAGLEPDCDFVFETSDYNMDNIFEAVSFKPDAVLFMDSLKRALPQGLDEIDSPFIACFIDSTLNRFWQTPLAHICALTLYDQKPEAESASAEGLNAQWFPLAADSAIFLPFETQKEFEISFIGNRHSANRIKRDNILNLLQKRFEVTIFSGHPPLSAYETAQVYNRSKLTLNENLFPALNLRLFEAMACGGAVLTEDYAPGLNDLFTNGEHLIAYNSENLLDKIEYYLSHDPERERLAENAAEIVARRHTQKTRAEELLGMLENLKEGRPIPRWEKRLHLAQATLNYALKWGKRDFNSLQYPQALLKKSLLERESSEAFLGLGKARFLEGDYSGAFEAFDAASQMRSGDYKTNYYLGSASTFLDRPELARRHFEIAANCLAGKVYDESALYPGSESFHLFWAETLYKNGDKLEPGLMKYHLPFPFWSALEHFHKAAQINPANWERVGDILMEFQAPDQALAAYYSGGSTIDLKRVKEAEKNAYAIIDTTSKTDLSLCMIVKNEADNLRELLGEIGNISDQIVVADTGSDDDSAEIARSFGAEVFDYAWNDDFAAARNAALDKARGRYILYLDGDDRIDPEELRRFKECLPQDDRAIFYVKIINQDSGEICLQKRVFPHRRDLHFKGAIHEQIIPTDSDFFHFDSGLTIRHLGYKDKSALKQKSERNLRLIKKEIAAHPDDPYLHYHAAVCLQNLGKINDAIEHLKLIVFHHQAENEHSELFEGASILLAKIFRRLGEIDIALKLLNNLLLRYPQSAAGRYYRGVMLFEEQLYNECKSEMEAFLNLEIRPQGIPLPLDKMRGWAFYYLARSLEHSGHLDKAVEGYGEALNILPETAKFYGDIGRALYRLGQPQQAFEYLQTCLEKHPGDRSAKKLLRKIKQEAELN